MRYKPVYNRILLELSGEMMSGNGKTIDVKFLNSLIPQLAELRSYDVQVGIVIGAGNIWRGADMQDAMNRPRADMVGMLGTIINALAIQGALEKSSVPSCVLSAINFEPVVEVKHLETYVGGTAIKHLQNGEIVIFAGGTGNPYFTTDTAAALRALQIGADVLLKATKVDGVYDSDPKENKDAKKFHRLSLKQAIQMNLRVMDIAAFSLCEDNNLPVIVFGLNPSGNIKKVVFGKEIGTLLFSSKSDENSKSVISEQ